MAGRSQQSFQKRQREKSKQEKQAAKRARRAERKEATDDELEEGRGEMEIMEDYRILSERYNSGEVEEEEYEQRKEELFEELGLAIGD